MIGRTTVVSRTVFPPGQRDGLLPVYVDKGHIVQNTARQRRIQHHESAHGECSLNIGYQKLQYPRH